MRTFSRGFSKFHVTACLKHAVKSAGAVDTCRGVSVIEGEEVVFPECCVPLFALSLRSYDKCWCRI